jgi:hypothetical protein
MTIPCSARPPAPSRPTPAAATEAETRMRTPDAKPHTQGGASASTPSASGSGNREKSIGTRASTAVANGSSESGAPSHRSASAATMFRRAHADSEARMEQRPPATDHPRPLLSGQSLENAGSAQMKRSRPWRGACAAAPRSARPGTGISPRSLASSRCGSGRCAPPEHTDDLEGEEPLRRGEPGRDLPALLLVFFCLRTAHLPVLLTLLLQRQARHSEYGRAILTKESQDCALRYIEGFFRVEGRAALGADGRGDRRGDSSPSGELLALRRSPDRVSCRGGRVGRNRPILCRGCCYPLGASSACALSGNPGRVRRRLLAQPPRLRHGLSSFQCFVRGKLASARCREAMMLSDPPERCHPVARRGLHGSNLTCCLSPPRRCRTVAAGCPGPV